MCCPSISLAAPCSHAVGGGREKGRAQKGNESFYRPFAIIKASLQPLSFQLSQAASGCDTFGDSVPGNGAKQFDVPRITHKGIIFDLPLAPSYTSGQAFPNLSPTVWIQEDKRRIKTMGIIIPGSSVIPPLQAS